MPRHPSIQIGYKLSSEEFPAKELVGFARAAEEHGFSFALISNHYHPWTDRQIGPKQERFMDFYAREIFPQIAAESERRPKAA